MYRVLTGFPPLMGGDLVECLYKHVNEMPAPFSQICPEYNLPEDLEAVIFKAVAKKPEDRYQSMHELKLGLESVEAYKVEIATKTYGSLAGISAAATLTSLPASASISYGGQSGDISTATSTQTAATTVSASTLAAASGPIIKDKETQTGDLPAVGATDSTVGTDSGVTPGETSSTVVSPQSSSSLDGTSSSSDAGALAAGTPGSVGRTVSATSPSASRAGEGGLKISKKTMIIGAIPLSLVAIIGIVALVSPSGNAKIEQLQRQAQAFYEHAQYDKAEEKIRGAINEGKKKQLPDNETSYYLLGKIQYAEADYPNAQSSLETALKLTQAKDGANSKEEAEVQASLGKTLTAVGNYKRAEQMLQQSYQTRKALNGDNSSLVADSLSGLGYLYVREHNYQKAITQLTTALRIVQSNTGGDSPETASALCTLGEAYQWQGNWPQAEALYSKALNIRQKKLDANNPLIADSLERLATVYLGEGNLMQAKTLYEKALAIESKSLDSASPRLAQTRQQLASIVNRLSGKRRR
jgi:tetratricopeptide (TPR) repeat protein